MVSPQLEDGYTRIAHEIVEALIRTNLSGQGLRLVLLVIRKTYGFGKKDDYISLSQMAKMANISRARCSQVITSLQEKRIITVKEKLDGLTKKYRFNKDYEQWGTVYKKITPHNRQGETRHPVNENITTKDNIKKKTLCSSQKEKDHRVKTVVDYFYQAVKEVRGFSPEVNGQDARTVQRLLAKHSEDTLKNMIDFFLGSEKADRVGITISTALSAHSINLYQQAWQKKKFEWGDIDDPPTGKRWWQ